MKLKSLTRAVAAAGVALAVTAGAAAAQVSYTTMGSFFGSGSCAVSSTGPGVNNTCSQGGITITYMGTVETVNPAALGGTANAQFGRFDVDGLSGANGSFTVPFTLTVTQTAPPAGSDDFAGTLAGQIVFDASNASITFSNTTLTLAGGYIYSLDNSSYNIIEPANANGGVTTIQGQLTVTPEPASLALLGSGLVGLAAFGIRQRRAAPLA